MKTTIIHHSADFDGHFCGRIAKKFMPDAEVIGWDFGDKPLAIPPEGIIYILDLPADEVFGFKFGTPRKAEQLPTPELTNAFSRIVWIDHHGSSIASHPKEIPGYRIDGVAACRLAWFYFTARERYASQTTTADFTWFQGHYPWAKKEDFVDRKVLEPLAVRLAGEYDIWDKRDERAEVFQFGLRSQELSDNMWELMLSGPTQDDGNQRGAAEITVDALLENGAMLQRYHSAVTPVWSTSAVS